MRHVLLVEFDTAVERSLTAEGEEDAVGPLPFDQLDHELGSHRQEIDLAGWTVVRSVRRVVSCVASYLVGKAGASLDGGDVGVDEDGLNVLLLQGLDGLRPTVVELTGLTCSNSNKPPKITITISKRKRKLFMNVARRRTDGETAGAEDEDLVELALEHVLVFGRRGAGHGEVDLLLGDLGEEVVEQVLGVPRPTLGLGVELAAEEGPGEVLDALVGLVVGVVEQLLPALGQRGRVDRESVVLRGQVAPLGVDVHARLVVATAKRERKEEEMNKKR